MKKHLRLLLFCIVLYFCADVLAAGLPHDCLSADLQLNGACPHSVWKHHAGDIGLWFGIAFSGS